MIVEKYNIALIPSKKSAELIKGLSQKVVDIIGEGFVVDNVNKHAHITLYMSHFPINNFENLLKKTEEIQNLIETPIFLDISGIEQSDGYVFLKIGNMDVLKGIHKKAVDLFSDLRNEYIHPKLTDKNFQQGLTSNGIDNINKYGALRVAKLYNPHITLTKAGEGADWKRLEREFKLAIKQLEFDSIALCKAGKNGVCKDILI